MDIQQYIAEFEQFDDEWKHALPWEICANTARVVQGIRQHLGTDYIVHGEVAIHRSAIVEDGVIIKGPAIIGKDCLVSAHGYLREGIFLGEGVKIGPHCEIKASIIFSQSVLAH